MEFKGVYVMSVENIEFLWQAFSWRYSNKVDGKSFQSTEAFMDYVKAKSWTNNRNQLFA